MSFRFCEIHRCYRFDLQNLQRNVVSICSEISGRCRKYLFFSGFYDKAKSFTVDPLKYAVRRAGIQFCLEHYKLISQTQSDRNRNAYLQRVVKILLFK